MSLSALMPMVSSLYSDSLSDNQVLNSSMQTYKYLQHKCNDPTLRQSTVNGYLSLAVYVFGILMQLVVLPANWRLSVMRSGFLFIFYINILDIFWLLEYAWICVEFLCGVHVRLPFNLEAFPFRLVNFSIDALHVFLSINRTMALVMPLVYLKSCTVKRTKQLVFGVFVCAALYSVFINWYPEQRPFHCQAMLAFLEPTSIIPAGMLEQSIPDLAVYLCVEKVYLVLIYIPLLLYVGTFAHMARNYLKKNQVANSSQTAVVSLSSNGTVDQERLQANLVLERTRLFLLCVLSTLPYYLANSLDYYTRIFSVGPDAMQILSVCWHINGIIFHVQQPFLMLWLSGDLRKEVRKLFSKALEEIGLKPGT